MSSSLESVAGRLAAILTAGSGVVGDPRHSDLEIGSDLAPRPLQALSPPADVWAVDGGQALVADAKCLKVAVTRASRVRFQGGRCTLEEEGDLRVHLLGGAEDDLARRTLGLDLGPGTTIDANLIRDRWEWEAVERAVDESDGGSVVLIDGDLLPDWRVPHAVVALVMSVARDKRVLLSAITKHSGLARGGAPLLGHLEAQAAEHGLSEKRWWAPVGRTRPGADVQFQVVAARLDPAARFSFRIDLPLDAEVEGVLGALAAISDDAAFPGYPYPLAVADRLAACPSWLRDETWMALEEFLHEAGVSFEVRERAFADRHRMLERV